MRVDPPTPFSSIEIPPAPLHRQQVHLPEIETPLPSATHPPAETMTVATKKLYLQLAGLTADTIKRKTRLGDAPLHLAATNGIIQAVPGHLLTVEMFMERNAAGDTPLHIAARNGYLRQVPSQFFTRATVTVSDASGETPLHIAARCGQFCRIPKRLLIPDLLRLPTNNRVANTVMHLLARANRLSQIPPNSITPELWNCPNGDGVTPCDIFKRACELLNAKDQSESWRSKALTEKQAKKLTFFGCTWDQGITRGQASDTIVECVKAFPDLNAIYYSRPATQEQLAILKTYLEPQGAEPDDCAEEAKPLTYGQAKELIWEWEMYKRQEAQERALSSTPPTEAQIKSSKD